MESKMTNQFKTTKIKLNNLTIHPDNVRAKSTETYTVEGVKVLAANIQACGLLQPMIVQKISKNKYGVVAGGRRLTALNFLAAKENNDFTKSMDVDCRVIDENVNNLSTISFSENYPQLPMDALDRFEAFSAMFNKDKASVSGIARTFGITELTVKQSLRLGNIHADIREAHRNGSISLETLRAFEKHPDPDTQLKAYKSLTDGHKAISPNKVSNLLQEGCTRLGSALGALVVDEYKAKNGEIINDLIEEDSILANNQLVEEVLTQKLADLAEEERERLGLSWADTILNSSWDTWMEFNRVYTEEISVDDKTQAKVDKLSMQADELQLQSNEADTWDEGRLLDVKIEKLESEIEFLTHAYSAEDAAIAGVVATWRNGNVDFEVGLVRAEDQPTSDAVSEGSSGEKTEDKPQKAKMSEALRRDLAHVRARGVALALAQTPSSARDYADFLLAQSILRTDFDAYNSSTSLQWTMGSHGPDDLSGSLALIEDSMAQIKAELELGWTQAETQEAGFDAFRALSKDQRDALIAYATAQTLTAQTALDVKNRAHIALEDEVLTNFRDVWTPDETFLKRLTKPDLLNILSNDLGMEQEAQSMDGFKKSGIVTYLAQLFAEPFATLTPDQSHAVQNWCPECLQRKTVTNDEAEAAQAA
jgi:ParB family chromosome partitioning protein